MKILLIKNCRIYSYMLPKDVKNNFWITDIDSYDNVRNLINIEAQDNRWLLCNNYDTHIIANNTGKVFLNEYEFYVIKNDSEKENYYLYALPDVESNYETYGISNGSLYIGKNNKCSIIYNCDLIEDVHAKIDFNDGIWNIIDNNSKFGIYVNGEKIKKNSDLHYGDIVFIAGLKLVIMKDFLLINNVNGTIYINSNILTIKEKKKYDILDTVLKDDELSRNLYAKEEYFYRSPRFIEDVIKEEVVIDNPPPKINQEETSLIMVIGPMFTMALTSLTTAFSTINNITNKVTTWEQSIPSLVVAGSMFMSMLIWPIIARVVERKRRKKKEAERITKYSAYLDEKVKEIESIITSQSVILKDKYVPLNECANIILRKKSNLWERSINQKDFLALRLGIGNIPINADIKYSKESFSMEEDELKKKIKEVVETRKMLVDVPITFSLIEKNITSIIGNNKLLHEFFKGQLLQLITFQSYEFLKIVILTNKENESDFVYLKQLPYIFDDNHQIRFFATNIDETKEISLYLERIYQSRKENKRNFSNSPPYYLIITDNYHMYRDIEIINDILTEKDNYGFSLMIFSEKLQNLPSECKNFINVNQERSGIFESEISAGNQKEFQTEFCQNIRYDDVIKKICNIPIEFNNDEKAFPDYISFLEMYNVGKVEQLNIDERYSSNNSQKSLAVPIGIEKSGSILKLDLHEKYHGPHGLIAGMTGSGKSELIITYILSMAVNFSPLDVAFILIDYKGGGLAGAFENRETGISLPHLAGTITNLDVSEMNRSLSSIQSELRRRQQLFNEARDKLGESTVDIYKYQRFYKEGKVEEAVPHLFIICDEFAELKTSQPDFMEGLIQAARIGRSLGVHLILATQKPSGVVNDQIWSNSRFRICLKVQEKSDSNEMIKTPEAALLKQAGRFYLQVGYNELFALGQSAWCGARYFPTDKIKKKIDQSVAVIDDIGNIIGQYDDLKENMVASSGEELSNVLNYVIECCNSKNLRANKLWLEKILPNIYVDSLVKKYQYTETPYILRPIIGEYDDPSNQRQELLYLDLSKDGNTSIYGSAGSGKELLFSSIIYSLITSHTPNEVSIYIMDFGSGSLGNFRGAPHIGDIIFPTEEEKIKNIFRMIEKELDKRKKLFIDYNGDYQNYIMRSGNKIPYVILFINNYDVFQDAYDYEDVINKITRECSKYGIVFLASVNTTGGMRYKLRQNFHSNITLQFNDQDDYSMIVGNTKKLYPSEIYGRGLVKLDNLYEFQTAHIFKDDEYLDKLKDVINGLKQKYRICAPPIPVVPEVVYISNIESSIQNMKNIPVGINKDYITPELFNFKDNYITLISSNEDNESLQDFSKAITQVFSKVSNNNIMFFDVDSIITEKNLQNVLYINDSFEEVIKKLCDSMDYEYNLYIQNNYRNITNSKNQVVVIYRLSKLLMFISDDLKKRFLDYLVKCRDLKIFDFIFIDSVNNFKKYEYETWYKTTVSSNYGIWIGNGVADQSLIKTNVGFKKENNEIPKGYGIVIKNMKTSLVNMIVSDKDNKSIVAEDIV